MARSIVMSRWARARSKLEALPFPASSVAQNLRRQPRTTIFRAVILASDEEKNSHHSSSRHGGCRHSAGLDFLPAAPGQCQARQARSAAAQSGLLRQHQETLSLRSEICEAVDSAAGLGQGGILLSVLSVRPC